MGGPGRNHNVTTHVTWWAFHVFTGYLHTETLNGRLVGGFGFDFYANYTHVK